MGGRMNRAAQALGRLGGAARSSAKTAANREKMRQFWQDVRDGKRKAPKRGKAKSPTPAQ
jgi:hypothetical protein